MLHRLRRAATVKQGLTSTSFRESKLRHSIAPSKQYHTPFKLHLEGQRLSFSDFTHKRGISSSFLFGAGPDDSPADNVERTERNLGSRLESAGTASTNEFLAVFRALADSKLPDAPLKAERWLRRLEQLEGVPVTSECYQRVIEAWARAESEDPARVVTRAESWLDKAQKISDDAQKANTACFNAFLDVCTSGRSFKGSRGGGFLVKSHAEIAERVLRLMIRERQRDGPKCRMAPNIESFNLVIRGWTRCRKTIELADRATNTLRLLEQYSAEIDSTVEPNSRTYGLLMDALSVRAKLKVKRLEGKQGPKTLDPAHNGLQEIDLIRSMIEVIYQKRNALEPNNVSSTYNYNVLLGCWANISSLHENATAEAEQLLRHMVALKESGQLQAGPDATSYLMTMRVWGNSTKANKGERVTWLLSKQWKDYEFSNDEFLRPTTAAYNMCLRVWSDLENPQEANKILNEMTRLSDDIYGEALKPNSTSFAYVFKAWLKIANKGSEKALIEAQEWLDRLMEFEKKEGGVLSSVELFLDFLGSARFCASHFQDALGLCFHVLESLRKSRHMIDALHYSRLLEVALLALPNRDDDEVRYIVIERIITECKDDGLVSNKLLKALSNGPVRSNEEEGWTIDASRNAVQQHFPVWPLPTAWTRNLKKNDHEPKKSDLLRENLTSKFYKLGPKRQWQQPQQPKGGH